MTAPTALIIHTDGASRGNPGAAAFAYVIERDDETLVEEAGCLGKMTNNQAEYTALVRALEHALELDADAPVVLHSDSELMVKQMNGEYRVRNADLIDLYNEARELLEQLRGGVTFRHVRREQNKRADQLCNEALDGKRLEMPRASTLGAGEADFAGAPSPAPKKPAAQPTLFPDGLRDDAIACLRQAVPGDRAALLWDQLAGVLRRHGVALPD